MQKEKKLMDSEVENISAPAEIVPPQPESQREASQNEAQVESRQDRNWREMRKAQDELIQKTKLQEEMIARLLSVQKPVEPAVDHEWEELEKIADDEHIPKGKVKKLINKAKQDAAQSAQEAVEKAFEQREKSRFMDKLKSQFSDFDDIVNPETLSLLEENDPQLAITIAEVKDPYKIGLQSYKYIKALGLADKVPQARRVKEVEKKLEQNAKTVQSPQAFDKRPMAQAFRLTETEKRDLYNEMMEAASRAGGGY